MSMLLTAEAACVVVDPLHDNVAVSRTDIAAGDTVAFDAERLRIRDAVPTGHRFALAPIAAGEPVVQYGCTFGVSRGIEAGELIHTGNVADVEVALDLARWTPPPMTVFRDDLASRTFAGYRREDKRVGTRNYFLIVPTSQCCSETAAIVANEASRMYAHAPNIDGIVAIPNTEGCGCAGNIQIDRFLRVLLNFMVHPNVGGVLVVDLGCEQTNRKTLWSYIQNSGVQPHTPLDWVTIQEVGGTQKSIVRGLEIIGSRIAAVSSASREACSIRHLVVGTECGASDAFSGITANVVIGAMVDKVIAGRGSAILSEVPEMIGAEDILLRRMRDEVTALKFINIVRWYRDLATTLHVRMSDNLVPENRTGGLINPCIKSLGAIAKGGTTVIEDVLEYGERQVKEGLNIMQGPGSDLESVTGLAASGASIICFSTGRGTVTGSAIVPVVKISSTSGLYRRMREDMDFDAGRLLDTQTKTCQDALAEELLELVISVASGAKTASERNGQRQFQVWTAGKLSL